MSGKTIRKARKILRKELRQQVKKLGFLARCKLAFFTLIGKVDA